MLAVLRVITGGFKYMTTEAIGAKGDARETIQGAVFGLILLLGSWLILNTVNPQILDLSALQFESLQQEGDAKAFSEKARKERAEAEERAREFAEGTGIVRIGGQGYVGSVNDDPDSLGRLEEDTFKSACRANGREWKKVYLGGCEFNDGSIRREGDIICPEGSKPHSRPSFACVEPFED